MDAFQFGSWLPNKNSEQRQMFENNCCEKLNCSSFGEVFVNELGDELRIPCSDRIGECKEVFLRIFGENGKDVVFCDCRRCVTFDLEAERFGSQV